MKFTPVSEFQWLGVQSTSGNINSEFKFQVLPNRTLTHEFVVPEDVMGQVIDDGLLFNPPYIRLASGNIAVVDYCSAVMKNGIYIFECYDLQTLDPIFGYWVAMRVNYQNNDKLEYITELQMTSQFWSNFYTYIINDEAKPNSLIFVNYSVPFNDGAVLESYITTLSFNNGILTAEDTFNDFGGETTLSLFNNLTGNAFPTITPAYTEPIFSADDNFVDMMIGDFMGWVYYWDNSGLNYPLGSSVYTNVVGYNVLTGQVRNIQPVNNISGISNFSPVDVEQAIVDVYSHPKGLLCVLNDQLIATNGQSLDGVTALWSPDWQNNGLCIRLDSRGLDYGFANTAGGVANLWGLGASSIPVTTDYFYCFDYDPNNPISVMVWRWELDSLASIGSGAYDYNCFALANETSTPIVAFVSPTPNGMFFIPLVAPFPVQWSADLKNIYWNNNEREPIQFQWNGILPTNFINNRLIDSSDFGTFRNWMIYGAIENIYNNIKF